MKWTTRDHKNLHDRKWMPEQAVYNFPRAARDIKQCCDDWNQYYQ